MGTPKTGTDNLPVLNPADAMFDAHPHSIQQSIKFKLGLGQLTTFRFFEGRVQDQPRDLVSLTGLIDDRDQRDSISEALIAFIGLGLAIVRQPLHGPGLIADRFIMLGPRHRLANRLDVVLTIGHKLGFQAELLFLPE